MTTAVITLQPKVPVTRELFEKVLEDSQQIHPAIQAVLEVDRLKKDDTVITIGYPSADDLGQVSDAARFIATQLASEPTGNRSWFIAGLVIVGLILTSVNLIVNPASFNGVSFLGAALVCAGSFLLVYRKNVRPWAVNLFE